MSAFKGFHKDGKPFFPLGAQAHNSSSYTEADFRHAALCTKNLCCNTIEAPVYWHKIEPQENVFDFTIIDYMIKVCREMDLKLVVLWFASWKNGDMSYCPAFVKEDTKRFPRALAADGTFLQDLSAHVDVNKQADAKAFAKFMEHVKQVDEKERTVIAIQVENEPGFLRSDRDYNPASEADLQKNVPDGLIGYIESRGQGFPFEQWKKYGSKRSGAWQDVFGIHGIEFCEAYALSQYIDYVAECGKKAYDIPMYINVWLGGGDFGIPGLGYPAGGALVKVLDIWKFKTPSIDFIAPDIYVQHAGTYKAMVNGYSREDNPLFVPESGAMGPNVAYMFYALGAGNAIGYAIFGVESSFELDGSIRPAAMAMQENNQSLQQILPLLCQYRGTGKIHSVVQEENLGQANYEFERYYGCVKFAFEGRHGAGTGYRGRISSPAETPLPYRGLIFEVSPTEFYLVGNFHLKLAYKSSPARNLSTGLWAVVDFAVVEEGYFDQSGKFVVTRERNGDEVMFGDFWVTPFSGVTHIKLIDTKQ